MDDGRVGAIARAIRRRRALRQADVAQRARVSQVTVSRLERGHLDTLSLRTVRAILAALDIRLDLLPRWRGAALDRVVDEAHAAMTAVVVDVLEGLGWQVELEVTYSRFGERGSIDILAFHRLARVVLVIEIKTELVSIEETVRRLDQKTRLAPAIGRERFGWQPVSVGRLLVLPSHSTERRRAGRHAGILRRVLPVQDARTIRGWLTSPSGALSGLWFVAFKHPGTERTARQRGRQRPGVSPSTKSQTWRGPGSR